MGGNPYLPKWAETGIYLKHPGATNRGTPIRAKIVMKRDRDGMLEQEAGIRKLLSNLEPLGTSS
jgi:hypothetical protein